MNALSASEVLTAWEHGLHARPVQRAMQLLSLRFPGQPVDDLAKLSIGRRDAALLDLRLATFGNQVSGKVVCPKCGERLELALDINELRKSETNMPDGNIALEMAGYQLQLRLPNSYDLAEAADQETVESGRQKLLERCVVSASRGAEPTTDLPPEVVAAAMTRMAEADPQADLCLNVACCGCGNQWAVTFDIVSFLWTEIEAWAGRLIHDVHLLASAYGWSEREILSLSAVRRQMYLEMVTA